jgi:hypothetical protein
MLAFDEYTEYLEFKKQHRLHKWHPAFVPKIELVNSVEEHDFMNEICKGLHVFRPKLRKGLDLER